MEIRLLQRNDLAQAMELTKKVFMEFDAPDYSTEGIENFLKFIETENIYDMFDHKELYCYGYYNENEILGIIATTGRNHICLLFVDKACHRRGIATKLFSEALKYRNKDEKITVHSSPYAFPIYRHWGFIADNEEQLVDGMRFIPMTYDK